MLLVQPLDVTLPGPNVPSILGHPIDYCGIWHNWIVFARNAVGSGSGRVRFMGTISNRGTLSAATIQDLHVPPPALPR